MVWEIFMHLEVGSRARLFSHLAEEKD